MSDDPLGIAGDEVAVGEDHALEVPLEDTQHALAHERLVAPTKPVLGRRAGRVPHPDHPKQEP